MAVDVTTGQVVGPSPDRWVEVSRRAGVLNIRALAEDDPMVVVFHERPERYKRLRTAGRTRRIGHAVFELDELPAGWAADLASMDEVWVASEFNRDGFAASGVPRFIMHKIPHSLDTWPYRAMQRARDTSTTRFLAVVSGQERRDLGLLLRSFLAAFQDGEDVEFVVKLRNELDAVKKAESALIDAGRAVGGAADLSRVRLVAADLGPEQMIQLMTDADVYVSPERVNGWDLPSMEAMAAGVCTVGVDYGGAREFANENNSIRVPVASWEVPMPTDPPNPLYLGRSWPGVVDSDMTAALRRAFDPDVRSRLGSQAAADIRSKFDIRVIGDRLLDRLSRYQPEDYGNHRRAQVWYGPKSDFWAEPTHSWTKVGEDVLAGTVAAKAVNVETLRELQQLQRKLPGAKPGPLQRAVAASSAATKRNPVTKAKAIASVGREVTEQLRQADREQLSAVARGVRRIDPRLPDPAQPSDPDRDIADRRAALGRYPALPVPGRARRRLRDLKDRHLGERVVIMGNGPSLNKVDLDLLADEYTFGVNKIYLLFDRIGWRPTYYTLLDWRVGPEIAPDIEAVSDSIKFLPHRFRSIIPADKRTYWYHTRPIGDTLAEQFTTDMALGIPSRGTVLVTAIQQAFHLGFRDIILIGVDASYSVPDSVIQSGPDRFGTGVKLNLESTRDDDPNHFDPTYFGAGAKWHDPNVPEMLRCFRHMRKGVEYHGGRIRNATPGGNLEVFDRVDYADLFGTSEGRP